MNCHEYEEVIKGVMAARRTAEAAASKVQPLDDKARFVKLGRKLLGAQNILRLMLFEFEDAAKQVGEVDCE